MNPSGMLCAHGASSPLTENRAYISLLSFFVFFFPQIASLSSFP